MADYLLKAAAAKAACGNDAFAEVLQEGMRHYEKYINQMLDDSGQRDLPLAIACLEASVRALKGNVPKAAEVSDVLLEQTMTIMTKQRTGGGQ